LKEAGAVFTEIMSTPNKRIPEGLLGKADCVVIIPGMRSGVIGIGGRQGLVTPYAGINPDRVGEAPATMCVEGGSFGFQIGPFTDVVMLVDRPSDTYSMIGNAGARVPESSGFARREK
jgi:lipid-binding SYLF domain-containing protein